MYEINSQKPLVSVIIPSFNHEVYIRDAIISVINQTYTNIELIVVDDGSTDNSINIIDELQKRYHFIKIFQSNKGLSKTLTDTIKNYCNGYYISVCASDDYWREDKIEVQVKFMQLNVNNAMCYSKCYYIDEKSNLKFQNIRENMYKGGNIFNDLLLVKYNLPVSYLIKKEVLKEIGYYPDNIYCEDFYMNLKISKNYTIGFIDDYLMFYRVQANSYKKALKIIKSQYAILLDYQNESIYKKALLEWKLRSFSMQSYYPELKRECISFVFDLKLIFHLRYWKSILKLIIK